MITAGVIMPNFRLKVNLSKFFQDVRKFCWIYIDGTKIQQVMHIKQHISSVFNITEPFHLLLNDAEYLPPNEDVRILEENETILVVPGSGISNENDSKIEVYSNCNTRTVLFGQDKKDKKETDLKAESEVSLLHDINTTELSNDLNNTQQASINITTADMTFYSLKDDTVIENTEENDSKYTNNSMKEDIQTKDNSVISSLVGIQSLEDNTCFTEEETDSKSMSNNVTEDIADFLVPITKRKRVRKRKPRNRSQSHVTSHSDIIDEEKPKKPKIIESYIIPVGKHIRFNTEDNENNIVKRIVQEISGNESSDGIYKDLNDFPSRENNLSTLLALKQCSTPKTYVNNKIKKIFKTEELPNNEVKNALNNKTINIENDSTEKNLYDKSIYKKMLIESLKDPKEFLNLENYPVMNRKPKVEDIIAFKTLKIGTDFTPQISNFIVAEVVDVCPQSLSYTLKLLSGKEEVQVPFGKFSISNDESVSENNTNAFKLNYSQMNNPRLLYNVL